MYPSFHIDDTNCGDAEAEGIDGCDDHRGDDDEDRDGDAVGMGLMDSRAFGGGGDLMVAVVVHRDRNNRSGNNQGVAPSSGHLSWAVCPGIVGRIYQQGVRYPVFELPSGLLAAG